jgi:HIV-1 Vpr-binding protein
MWRPQLNPLPSILQVRLYDVNRGNLELTLTDSQAGSLPGHGSRWGLGGHSNAYFSPDDSLILWGGVLWDHRLPKGIHRFDQFTDYGGGAFHPAGNEVSINALLLSLLWFG